MHTIVYGDDLFDFPDLATEMFQDRRKQFCEELGWNLNVDALGREIDEYDLMNPLYVILRDDNGHHLASGRLMPTTGQTMIADHFSDLIDSVHMKQPLIWEVTRVFVARRDKYAIRNAAALMWAGCQIGLRVGVQKYVSVTPKQMTRVFAACGWPAKIIGARDEGTDREICGCLWEINEENCERLALRAGIEQSSNTVKIYRHQTPEVSLPSTGLTAAATSIGDHDAGIRPGRALQY